MDAVLAEIVPEGRWEDFETYWSCCGRGRDKYLGETGDRNYERGVAALKSGFIMMYCPENTSVKKMWEKVYPWFGPEDYGFTMENYAHGGRTSAAFRFRMGTCQ